MHRRLEAALKRANGAMDAYKERLLGESEEYVLIDILTDLRHWALVNGRDFNGDSQLAQAHFDYEKYEYHA